MGIVPSVFLYVLLHSIGSLSYALFDSLYGMLTPDVERTSTRFWLLHWSQYCDIRGVSTVDRKLGASTDLGIYNAWRSDMRVCMICRDISDADRCRAGMRASVLAVCTPFSIHNITLWSSCGMPASSTSTSDPLKTFACLIALRRYPFLATSPIASCCASLECLCRVLFLYIGAVNCMLATSC